MKRKFWICLSALVLMLMLAVLPQDALIQKVQAATSGNFTYTVADGEATITDFPTSYSGALTIPSTLDGYPVTNIGEYAFYDCDALTSVTIPDSVTSIGDYAFEYCTALTSVTIGNSVTSIGERAFRACHNLPSIIIPNSVTSIGYASFNDCISLNSITIPDSVTKIGGSAFSSCDTLKTVTIGKNVQTIGFHAWMGAPIKKVYISDIASWCQIAFSDMDSSPLYGEDASLYLNGSLVTDLVIPNSVTSIKAYAFNDCQNLTSLTIPDSVTSIGEYAFSGTDIASIKFGNALKVIGLHAFRGCWELEEIILPEGLTHISDWAFYQCPLRKVTIPDSVEAIGGSAFESSYWRGGIDEVRFYSLEKMNLFKTRFRFSAPAFICLCKDDAHVFTDEADMFCNNCLYARIFIVPTVLDFDDTTVTLQAIDGYEYRMDDDEWTTDPVFTGLTPNSIHSFYLRLAATDAHHASDPSAAVTVTTLKSTVAAPAAPTVAEKTDTTITLQAVSGHEYKMGDGAWTTNPVFTGLNPNAEYSFYQRVAETKTTYASVASVATTVTTLKSTVSAPAAPTVAEKNDTTITLQAIDGYEYKMGDGTWTTNPVFTGLNPSTEYMFYQRVAETDTTYASEASIGTKVTTLKSTVAAPTAPVIAEKTDKTVTLQTISGYEYKMNDGEWTTNPIFTGLNPTTEYTFYQRVAETNTTYASESSDGTTVKTDTPAFVPGWFSDNGVWYYYNTDGTLATGWLFDGAWYYLNADGSMATGWVNDGGTWYYMNSSGAMMTGWLYDGAWYYLNASGAMATGWVNDGGTWYYMNGSGAMMTGWVNDGGTWYYMNAGGAMVTGWVNDGGTWYYMYSSGAMATGWVLDGGTWYYMDASGAWVA